MADPATSTSPTPVAQPLLPVLPHGMRWLIFLIVLGLAATAVRFGYLAQQGLLSFGAYDDGVHYAAAANLLAGKLPYADFVFLHPPGIVLLGTPFAALAHWVGDPVAFVAFRISGQVAGGLTTVLVALVLRRFGWGAAISGGVLYALSYPAVYGGRSALLEPYAEALVLLALLWLGRGTDFRRKRWYLLAGLAAGLSLDFKAWYIGPVLVLLLFAPGWAGRWRFALGAAISAGAIYLPFLIASHGAMFRMLVTDQLGRPLAGDATLGVRLRTLLGVGGPPDNWILPGVPALPTVLVLLTVLGFLGLLLLHERRAWVFLGLLAVTLAITLRSPSFFQHYAILTAAPLALVGGAAVGFLPGELSERRGRRRALGALFTLIAITGAALVNVRHDLSAEANELPTRLTAAMRAVDGCVLTDDPTPLAISNILTRDLERGCNVVPDLSGISYDYAKRLGSDGKPLPRAKNVYFQTVTANYLLSGDAYIRFRGGAYGFDGAREEALRAGEVLYKGEKYTLRAPAAN